MCVKSKYDTFFCQFMRKSDVFDPSNEFLIQIQWFFIWKNDTI